MTEHENINYVNPNALTQINWVKVGVRAGRVHQTHLMRMPLDIQDMGILSIYAGDTMAIAPSVRYENYVMARVGVQIGWVSFNDVKFIPLQMSNRQSNDETKPSVSAYERERLSRNKYEKKTEPAVPKNFSNIRDSLSQPSQSPATQPAESVKKSSVETSHIRRLIGYMKSLIDPSK